MPITSLSVFGQIFSEKGTGVVQFKEGSGVLLKSGGTYRSANLLGRGLRAQSSRAANNAIRTELLRSLAAAFQVGGQESGEIQLTDGVVEDLERELGAGVLCDAGSKAFKLDKDGKVVSGSPLTERRITKILVAAKAKLDGKGRDSLSKGLHEGYRISSAETDRPKASLDDVLRGQEQRLVDTFGFKGKLDPEKEDADFNVRLKWCFEQLGIDPKDLEKLPHDKLEEARKDIIAGLKDPNSATSFFRGLEFYNNEIAMLAARGQAKPKPVAPEALIEKLNAAFALVLSRPKPANLDKALERRATRHFAGLALAASRACEAKAVPHWQAKVDESADFMPIFRTIGDVMRSSGRAKPNLFDMYRGLGAVLAKSGSGKDWAGVAKAIQEKLSTSILQTFVALPFSDFSEKDKEHIQVAVNAFLGNLNGQGVEDEKTLQGALCDKFNKLNLFGGLKLKTDQARHALSTALEAIANELAGMAAKNVLLATGGKLHEKASFSFTHVFEGKSKTFKSTFVPVGSDLNPSSKINYEKAELNLINKLNDWEPRKQPVVNLMMSNLSVSDGNGGEENLVSFVRFGQAACAKDYSLENEKPIVSDPKPNAEITSEQKPTSASEKLIDRIASERKVAAHQAVALTVLMNNMRLRDEARSKGTVTVPVYRVDMCCFDENVMSLSDPEKMESFTFVLDGKKVTVKPEIHHFVAAVDGVPQGHPLRFMSKEQLGRTCREVDLLLKRAAARPWSKDMTEEKRGKIEKLCKSLGEFREKYLNETKANNWILSVGDRIGPAMLRFGSQVAMLASLLGETPAINCNWGKDRTGAMDSEIKMLAARLAYDPEADLSIFKGAELPARAKRELSKNSKAREELRQEERLNLEKKSRREFLRDTGNAEIARQMYYRTEGINLDQGKVYHLTAFGSGAKEFAIIDELPNEIVEGRRLKTHKTKRRTK